MWRRPSASPLWLCWASVFLPRAPTTQWAGGGQVLVLGKDEHRKSIYAAAEVFEVIQRERLGLLAA